MFHWHITDSQSFPLRLESIPELAEHGAYVLGQRRLVYSKKDVERVVDYARARGVRVIPEIDMVSIMLRLLDIIVLLTLYT